MLQQELVTYVVQMLERRSTKCSKTSARPIMHTSSLAYLDLATDTDGVALPLLGAAGRRPEVRMSMPISNSALALKVATATELQRIGKRHAYEFANFSAAAAVTMRTEVRTRPPSSSASRLARPMPMLWQTNHQRTAYETMRFLVQRTVERPNQSDCARRANAEPLRQPCRAAHDVVKAAESLRLIEREHAVNEQPSTYWVRRQDTQFKNDVMVEHSRMQRPGGASAHVPALCIRSA